MSETVVEGRPGGFTALVGRLEVRIVGGDAHFVVEAAQGQLHPHSVEIEASAVTVGCGGDADCRLAGPSTRGVSRRHLLLQPAGRQWTVLDCSKNGTRELYEDGRGRDWRRLTSDFPIPVTSGMRLRLGAGLELGLALIQDQGPGGTTATEDGALSFGERIADFELERIARALLAPRRSGSNSIPVISDLAPALLMSRQTLHRRIDELGKLPEVQMFLADTPRSSGRQRSQDVADALARAFPYLTAPGVSG